MRDKGVVFTRHCTTVIGQKTINANVSRSARNANRRRLVANRNGARRIAAAA